MRNNNQGNQVGPQNPAPAQVIAGPASLNVPKTTESFESQGTEGPQEEPNPNWA